MLRTISIKNSDNVIIVIISNPKSALYLVAMMRMLSPNSEYTVKVFTASINHPLSNILSKIPLLFLTLFVFSSASSS